MGDVRAAAGPTPSLPSPPPRWHALGSHADRPRLQSLLLFLGPLLLPRVLGMYRRLRTAAAVRAQQSRPGGSAAALVRPLAPRTVVVLGVLAAAAVAWLLSGGLLLPAAASRALHLPAALRVPENVFAATQSRLQAPTDVLFTRLAAQRPGRALTPGDEALRRRLVSLESRLLYLQYGPDVLADCPFCGGTGVDAGTGAAAFSAVHYLYYALLDLVAAHLANLVLVAAATSPLLLLGRKGASSSSRAGASAAAAADRAYDVAAAHVRRWRAPASVAALVLAGLDLYVVAAYDRQANARAARLGDLDPFFWSMRAYRGAACGGLLAALAGVLYLAASGRHGSPRLGGLLGVVLFGALPPAAVAAAAPAQRVAAAAAGLAVVKSKLSAGAIVKNTALRDAALRARTEAYWAREVRLVAAAMEEREVLESVNDALENRIDMQRVVRDAAQYAENVVPPLAGPSRTGGARSNGQAASGQQPQVIVSRSSTPVAAGNKPVKRK